MSFKLIDNLSNTKNHSTRLRELFGKSDSVILTSPFLMTDFTAFFEEVDSSQINKLHLITTLCPGSLDQVNKISSLISLIEISEIKDKKIDCRISINNKLHGKVYIFKKDSDYVSAIISSANFTHNGLSRNHEWGVEISDKNEIQKVEQTILGSIEFPNLSFEDIYEMQRATKEFQASHPRAIEQKIDLNLTSIISNPAKPILFDNTINFWLKPIGVSDDPVTEDRLFNKITDNLHFSVRQPSGVKPNDILICYGVGTTKMLSLYQATSLPTKVPDQKIKHKDEWLKRWPWYVKAHNLTPNFGTNWAKHSLLRNSLLEEYLAIYPEAPITARGGQTLGAFNFGQDKLKLTPDFAKFIIKKMTAINDNN